jgi:hypothetical protein
VEDTPEHIKQLQLKIWLAKAPGERLRQFIVDNDTFFKMINAAKASLKTKQKNNKTES